MLVPADPSTSVSLKSAGGGLKPGSAFTCTQDTARWITSCCRERRLVVRSMTPSAGVSLWECPELLLPEFSVLTNRSAMFVLPWSICLENLGKSVSEVGGSWLKSLSSPLEEPGENDGGAFESLRSLAAFGSIPSFPGRSPDACGLNGMGTGMGMGTGNGTITG